MLVSRSPIGAKGTRDRHSLTGTNNHCRHSQQRRAAPQAPNSRTHKLSQPIGTDEDRIPNNLLPQRQFADVYIWC
jgi:hypothetical protein